MRSSWDEVDRLFISQWGQMSTPLHLIFMGKDIPLTLNGRCEVGEKTPQTFGESSVDLRGAGFEVYVFLGQLETVEYRAPAEAPAEM